MPSAFPTDFGKKPYSLDLWKKATLPVALEKAAGWFDPIAEANGDRKALAFEQHPVGGRPVTVRSRRGHNDFNKKEPPDGGYRNRRKRAQSDY